MTHGGGTAMGEKQFICVNFGITCAFQSTVSEGGLIHPGKEGPIDRSVADIADEKPRQTGRCRPPHDTIVGGVRSKTIPGVLPMMIPIRTEWSLTSGRRGLAELIRG